MQPALGRRRHRRSNNTISLVSRGYVVGCYVRSPSQRWKCVAASSASHPVMRAILPLLYAHHRLFAGLGPSGLTPSSVLKCGLINHRDGVMTYVRHRVTSRSSAGRSRFGVREPPLLSLLAAARAAAHRSKLSNRSGDSGLVLVESVGCLTEDLPGRCGPFWRPLAVFGPSTRSMARANWSSHS
jgi:hypothetical protein